ncbi:MAG: Wzt carbohydrate-binding domain-containing protein, partial [Anaerolineae bacterium]|nr:Wzt carbohydrate-binding domain-containing protein [Anaerolineae bacterium]
IFLQNGRVIADCSISEAVNAYLNSLEKANIRDISTRTDRQGRGKVRLTKVEILGSGNIVSNTLATGQPACFKFNVSSLVRGMSCLFDIFDHLGNPVAKFQTDYVGDEDEFCEENGLTFTCEIDELLLMPGRYRINVLIRGDGEWQDFIEGASIFDVEEGTIRGRPIPAHKVNRANVSLPHRWKSPALS